MVFISDSGWNGVGLSKKKKAVKKMMSQMRKIKSTVQLRCLPGKPSEVGVEKFAAWCESTHLPQFPSVYLKLPQRVGSVVGETLIKELIIVYKALGKQAVIAEQRVCGKEC